jgi:citrate lyase beta subunit
MKELREEFLANSPERILALRVGGNDLMSCLGLRRMGNASLYEGPLFYVVSMLMSVMRPKGFDLTAPVFDNLDEDRAQEPLLREVTRDVSFGFVGKTVIHPSQVDIVQNAFKVASADYQAALKILSIDAAAVFKFGGSMCEPATHRSWAQRILSRTKVYGLVDGEAQALSIAAE